MNPDHRDLYRAEQFDCFVQRGEEARTKKIFTTRTAALFIILVIAVIAVGVVISSGGGLPGKVVPANRPLEGEPPPAYHEVDLTVVEHGFKDGFIQGKALNDWGVNLDGATAEVNIYDKAGICYFYEDSLATPLATEEKWNFCIDTRPLHTTLVPEYTNYKLKVTGYTRD